MVATPPNRGAPDLERSHGFHGKVVPGILLGPRCNHDLRNLLHLPVPDDLPEELRSKLLSSYQKSSQSNEDNIGIEKGVDHDDAGCISPLQSCGPASTSDFPRHGNDDELSHALEESMQSMVEQLTTRMHYAAGYAGKDQPHAANLLHTLHDSLVRFDHFRAEREAKGQSTEPIDCARRLLQSLVGSTNRRTHIGFPTVYAFVLGKPNHYCSHSFVQWSMAQLTRLFSATAVQFWTTDAFIFANTDKRGVPLKPPKVSWTPSASSSEGVATFKEFDYAYRLAVMERFPFYFF